MENAITCYNLLGGSTNAVIHLMAIAGRLGIDIPLETFDTIGKVTPLLANLRPTGKVYLMEDFFYAGGLPALLSRCDDAPLSPASLLLWPSRVCLSLLSRDHAGCRSCCTESA